MKLTTKTGTRVENTLKMQNTIITNVVMVYVLKKNEQMQKDREFVKRTRKINPMSESIIGQGKKSRELRYKDIAEMAKLLASDDKILNGLGLRSDIKSCEYELTLMYGEGAKKIALIMDETKKGVAFLIKDMWSSNIDKQIMVVDAKKSSEYGYSIQQIESILTQMIA
jgi:hypothetical protein